MFSILRTYYQFLWRYRPQMLLFGLFLVFLGIVESLDPYFYKLFIDSVSSGQTSRLSSILVGLIVVRIAANFFEVLMRSLGDLASLPAARDARLAVVNKIHQLDFAFHTSRSTGSLISAIKRGDGAFFDYFHAINISSSRVLIGFLTMLFFLSRLEAGVILILLITFGVASLIARTLVIHNINTRREFNNAEDAISDIIVDNLINFETVKLFAQEKPELNRLKKAFVVWMEKLWQYAISFRLIELIVGILGNFGFAVVLFYGLNQVKFGFMTVGDYVMTIGFITRFYSNFFELVFNFRNIAKHSVDIQKYFAILKEVPQVADPKVPQRIKEVRGEIKFSHIWFAYPKNKNKAVEEINLDIRSGQSVALVGHSGVGKTTLVKLLLRFYDPDSGKITIDGVDIKELRKSDLRAMVGVVPQEPIMFNNTIGYNITYGRSRATKQEMVAAAKMANLYDFIITLPQKFNTNVGERGVKLSGGQKQRLAIARMILKDPDIVIFDEATSQLDSESEKLIQEAFLKACANKTTIIVAHRLSTVVRAEKIVVMERGRIKEIGSHRQLLANNQSLYRKFWSMQTQARS